MSELANNLLTLLDMYAEEYSIGIMTVVAKSKTTGFTTIAFNGRLHDVTDVERVFPSVESNVFIGYLADGKAHEIRPIIQ